MTLLIDAGNSRIKWRWAPGEPVRSLPTAEADALGPLLRAQPAPDRTLIACVAGRAVRESMALALAGWCHTIEWISAGAQQCGVYNAYADPGQLGPDRWAALIAARARTGAPCIVACAGTALTVDALDAQGRFLGGLIVPGLRLMQQALAQGTAGLGQQTGRACDFPDNTADAMFSGVLGAAAGAIAGQYHKLAERTGTRPECLLSGGDAERLAGALSFPVRAVDNLVLEGLQRIAQA